MKLRELLAQLRAELQHVEDIDIDARRQLRELHADLEELAVQEEPEVSSALDRLKALESRFAATHPVLERTVRELADALAKMGV